MKIISRISKLNALYANLALKDTGLSSLWPKHRGLSFEEIYRDVTDGN